MNHGNPFVAGGAGPNLGQMFAGRNIYDQQMRHLGREPERADPGLPGVDMEKLRTDPTAILTPS